MPYIDLDGFKLYYEVHGSGIPLILISGMGGDLSFWTASLPILQPDFQCITFDNRGIGRSDAPDTPYSMELFADDIAGLMEHLGIESAHMLGFSMGGAIAQTFAVRHPQRLRKLVMAASFAKMSRQTELFLDAVLSVYEGGATNKQMYELILPWLFSSAFFNSPASAPFLEFDEEDPFQQPLYAFKRQYLAQREFDARETLSSIQAPTLVLAGEHDALVPVEAAQEIATHVAQSQFVLFPGAGHLINVEQPELFHATVLEFLRQVCS